MSSEIGFPKPKPRLKDRVESKREADKKAQAFRRAVWVRDDGICQVCRRKVVQTLELVPNRGEVHHMRGRNVSPEDRYNVGKARLLCAVCHGKVTRREIKVD